MSAKRKPDEPVGEMWSPEDAVEDAPRCEHGVLAGEHCSVCGTLSDPRTPLHDLRVKVQDFVSRWAGRLNGDQLMELRMMVENIDARRDNHKHTPLREAQIRLEEAEWWLANTQSIGDEAVSKSFLRVSNLRAIAAIRASNAAGPTIREVCEGSDK